MWTALTAVINLLPAQMVKELIDDLLDKIEDYAATAGTKGTAIQAGVTFIRGVADIPDDIGGDTD